MLGLDLCDFGEEHPVAAWYTAEVVIIAQVFGPLVWEIVVGGADALIAEICEMGRRGPSDSGKSMIYFRVCKSTQKPG